MAIEGLEGVGGKGLGGKGSRGVSGRRCGRSFPSDTPVLMAGGTTKPIGDVRPGDRVLAVDPETGTQGAQTVTAVWITTTDDHFFWNDTDRQWQPASALDRGDRVLTADGSLTTVLGLLDHTRHLAPAYSLTISELHTYYVLAGTTPVLVPNDDDVPNVVTDAIKNIQVGMGEKRMNPDGSLDIQGAQRF